MKTSHGEVHKLGRSMAAYFVAAVGWLAVFALIYWGLVTKWVR